MRIEPTAVGLLALALLILLLCAGCSTAARTVEEGGREYREVERRLWGQRIWLSRDPVPSPRERAVEGLRGPLRWLNWIGAVVGVVGFAAALALRQYGLQWAGRIAAVAGGATWGLTASALWALALPWWAWALAAAAAALAMWLARDRGWSLFGGRPTGTA